MKSVMNATENNRTTVMNNAAQAEEYVKPAIEVIEMETEGVLCNSAEDYGNGGHYN